MALNFASGKNKTNLWAGFFLIDLYLVGDICRTAVELTSCSKLWSGSLDLLSAVKASNSSSNKYYAISIFTRPTVYPSMARNRDNLFYHFYFWIFQVSRFYIHMVCHACQSTIFAWCYWPENVAALDSQNQSLDEVCVAQIRGSTTFDALKLWNVRSFFVCFFVVGLICLPCPRKYCRRGERKKIFSWLTECGRSSCSKSLMQKKKPINIFYLIKPKDKLRRAPDWRIFFVVAETPCTENIWPSNIDAEDWHGSEAFITIFQLFFCWFRNVEESQHSCPFAVALSPFLIEQFTILKPLNLSNHVSDLNTKCQCMYRLFFY